MPSGPYADLILAAMDRVNTGLTVEVGKNISSGPTGIRMSEIGYCARRIGYRLLAQHAKTPYRTGLGLTFSIGNFVEAMVVAAMGECGMPVENAQLELEHETLPLRGHIDGEAHLLDGEYALVEIKSANQTWFDAQVTEGVKAVYPVYFAQMQIYMHYTHNNRALYIVACKNQPDIYTELVPYEPHTVAGIIEKTAHILTLSEAGELPDPEYPKESRFCRQCPFTAYCPGKVIEGRGKTPFIVTN